MLRPPRRIFDAAPEPDIASPSRPQTLETAAAPVQRVAAGKPGAERPVLAAFAVPDTAPADLPPSLPGPSPSPNAVLPMSRDSSSSRSAQADPVIDRRLPDPASPASPDVSAGLAVTSRGDLAIEAEEMLPFLVDPSRVVRRAVTDRPPAAAPAPAAGRPLIVDHAAIGRPPADLPALSVGRSREEARGSASGSGDAGPGAARPPTLNPADISSDGLYPQFVAGPGAGQPAARAARSQITIGTIEVTVVPAPAPSAVPQVPALAPASAGPVAAPGRRGAREAARIGSRRWFGTGQG
jgi:hypothetical protein